ncbi:DUF2325 domain-containing protein [Magnetospirillum sp. 15-1]|uniref:DUF2325 domain-containing protein n=1 Tax=Magnetospirillum sp. 15-1 TaxID=1979370 RepID=UPI001482AB9C|nr:DUF2325 domain-containing protein [Magnetospirillum sp. 15-1]
MTASLPLQLPLNPAPEWSAPWGAGIPPQDGPAQPRRVRLWNISPDLHCSIIGTCLSLGEVRAFARKMVLCCDPAAEDHHLHDLVVFASGRDERVAKLLHKALDRKFGVALRRYERAADAAAVGRLWRDDMARGEIPGAYWAVVTHPWTDRDLLSRVFSDVHMLSHLVGASNRADIRRLQALEQENAELRDRLGQQRRQAAETLAARDHEIAELRDRPAMPAAAPVPPAAGAEAALSRRLARETRRRERMEARANGLTAEVERLRSELEAARHEAEEARAACLSLERRAAGWLGEDAAPDEAGTVAPRPSLDRTRLLFVGGKPGQVPHLRRMVAASGAEFMFHDGGLEDGAAQLSSQVAAAATVLFPVDCISHEAALRIKRMCRAGDKPFVPLRTFSLASVSRALDAIGETGAPCCGGAGHAV